MVKRVAMPFPNAQEAFPLSAEFQEILLKVLLEDRGFASSVARHIKPAYFSNHVHQWAWSSALQFQDHYGALPSLQWLLGAAGQLAPEHAPIFQAGMARVRDAAVLDEAALKETTLEFLKRAVFRAAHLDSRDLYNASKFTEAYDRMMTAMDELQAVSLENRGRVWLAETFVDRHIDRQGAQHQARLIGTGFPDLDRLFGGGAYPKFLGLWLANAKSGKTTMLINQGAVAARIFRKKVFHAVLEGSSGYIADRYDALLMDELYANVRRGDVDGAKYAKAFAEYQQLRGLIVVQDYTEDDASILHIRRDLKDLWRQGWKPDLAIIDYADLLRGRKTNYRSETEQQKDSFKDMRNLADSTDLVVWTASQVQRPGKDADETQAVLHARDIADCYAKVRIADFVGSLNQTTQEREQKVMRLHADLFRNGDAHKTFTIRADFERMVFGPLSTQVIPGVPQGQASAMPAVPPAAGSWSPVRWGQSKSGI